MNCKKKCPCCGKALNARNIIQPLYKRDVDVFKCKECDSNIVVAWNKVGGYIAIAILIAPGILLNGELGIINIVKNAGILLFVFIPIVSYIIYCLVPIRLKD